jgi:uncharacterized protein (TIGR03083 family)
MTARTAADEHLLDMLAETWGRTRELTTTVPAEQWDLDSDLPGWTARDVLAHVNGIEQLLLGRPLPEGAPEPDSANPIDFINVGWVGWYRTQPLQRCLDDFGEVTDARLAHLRSQSSTDLDGDTWTPTGPGSHRDMLGFRIMDSWFHEQDLRDVFRTPGGWEGPAAEFSIGRFDSAIGMILVKRAQATDGTSLRIELTGSQARTIDTVVSDGKGRRGAFEGEPTLTLVMDTADYMHLIGGRGAPAPIIDRVAIHGDAELAHRLLTRLAVLP